MSKSARANKSIRWFLGVVTRGLIGGLFLIAGFGKVLEPRQFADGIRAYELLPASIVLGAAYVLPWLELAGGFLLVIGFGRGVARLLIAVLLVVFTVSKCYALARGLEIDCGCGGDFVFLKYIYNNPQGIFTNLILLGLLGVNWRVDRLVSDGAAAVEED